MNKALFKYYFKQAVFVLILIFLYIVISVNGENYVYSGDRFTRGLPGWCFFALFCMNNMRGQDHYTFVNALPVTHKQQWMTVWLVNVCGIVLSGVLALIIYPVKLSAYGFGFDYYLFPILAEMLVVILGVTVLMWLCTIKIITIGRIIIYGFLFGALSAAYENMGRVAGLFLKYKGNNFTDIFMNRYNFFISPLKEYRNEVSLAIKSGFTKYIPDVSNMSYIMTYLLFTVLIIGIIAMLIFWGTKNYAKVDLSKEVHDQQLFPRKIYIYLATALIIIPIILSIMDSVLANNTSFTSSDGSEMETVNIYDNDEVKRTGICYVYDGVMYDYDYWDFDMDTSYVVVFIATVSVGMLISIMCGKILCGGIYYKGDGYSERQIKSNIKI